MQTGEAEGYRLLVGDCLTVTDQRWMRLQRISATESMPRGTQLWTLSVGALTGRWIMVYRPQHYSRRPLQK